MSWRGLDRLGDFDVVLADPPWSYYGQQGKWGAAAKFYHTQPDEAVQALPMAKLLRRDGVLFLWATCPRLDAAIRCITAWGLHYRGVAFVWVKTNAEGKPWGARGVRPSVVKPLTEMVLCASPVARGRPRKLASEAVVQTVFAPVGEHSAKPDAVQERIEMLYPGTRRLEMFARRSRDGWHGWGDEI